MSIFQEELRSEGYENVVIIAVGQSVASNFNSNFCSNSDLPLVVDVYPDYLIRDAFSGSHKNVVVLDFDQNEVGRISLSSGLNANAENYLRGVIADNYSQTLIGDINNDDVINVQDVILVINFVLDLNFSPIADLNSDNNVDVLDVVLMVSIILQS